MTSDDCAERAERYREISVNTLAHNERLLEENERLRCACSALVARLRIAEEQLEMDGALLDMRLVGDLKGLGVEV